MWSQYMHIFPLASVSFLLPWKMCQSLEKSSLEAVLQKGLLQTAMEMPLWLGNYQGDLQPPLFAFSLRFKERTEKHHFLESPLWWQLLKYPSSDKQMRWQFMDMLAVAAVLQLSAHHMDIKWWQECLQNCSFSCVAVPAGKWWKVLAHYSWLTLVLLRSYFGMNTMYMSQHCVSISSMNTKSVAERINITVDYRDGKVSTNLAEQPWGKYKQCPLPPIIISCLNISDTFPKLRAPGCDLWASLWPGLTQNTSFVCRTKHECIPGFEMGEHIHFEAYARELPVVKCHPEYACKYTEECIILVTS